MAVMRVGPLVPVRTATPCRGALVAVPRAAPATRGSVKTTRAVTPVVLGLRLPFEVRGSSEVHFVLRVMLAYVLPSSSSAVCFPSGVFPIGAEGPRGVGLHLGLRSGHLPSAGNVMPGELHTVNAIDGVEAHNGEFSRVVKLGVRDRREPHSELVSEETSQQSRVHLRRQGSSSSCHPTQCALENTWGSIVSVVYPFSLAAPAA